VDAVLNPYAPGAGLRPPELAGREPERQMFGVMLDRLEAGRSNQGIMLTGLRGVGKTVLLEELRATAETRGWVTAFIEAAGSQPFRLLASQALTRSLPSVSSRHRSSARLKRALSVFKAFSLKASPDGSLSMGIDVDAVVGRGDSGDLELDLSELLADLGEAAAELGAGVLLAIDELQALPKADVTALAGAAHQADRLGLPTAVVGAGLPNLPRVLTEAKSYAERLFAYRRIGALDEAAASEALSRPTEGLGVAWLPGALNRAVSASAGYPFFLQAFGKHIWDHAPGPDAITLDDADAGAGRRSTRARRGLLRFSLGTRHACATVLPRSHGRRRRRPRRHSRGGRPTWPPSSRRGPAPRSVDQEGPHLLAQVGHGGVQRPRHGRLHQ